METLLWMMGGMVGGWIARLLITDDDEDGGIPRRLIRHLPALHLH